MSELRNFIRNPKPADAWAAMQSAGIEWFDGDGIVRGGLPPRRPYPQADHRTVLGVVA